MGLPVRDPGPMARFREIVADTSTMGEIVHRLADGKTLKRIAKDWGIPYGRLAEWVTEDRERSEQYAMALAIWVDSLAQESVGIADDVEEDRDAVAKAKLQTSVRMGLATRLNRQRYGDAVEHKVSGSVSLIAVLSGLPRTGAVMDLGEIPALATGSHAAVEDVSVKNSEKKSENPVLI
jgi:hypothetical protein